MNPVVCAGCQPQSIAGPRRHPLHRISGLFSGKIWLVTPNSQVETQDPAPADGNAGPPPPRELGGRDGPEPTRYGDWELRGRCIDF
ncbi:MAG: succinate dehydrogenase assembly factor 4 [Steroidobacteraceae bacterium]|jgi:hypothetical protein